MAERLLTSVARVPFAIQKTDARCLALLTHQAPTVGHVIVPHILTECFSSIVCLAPFTLGFLFVTLIAPQQGRSGRSFPILQMLAAESQVPAPVASGTSIRLHIGRAISVGGASYADELSFVNAVVVQQVRIKVAAVMKHTASCTHVPQAFLVTSPTPTAGRGKGPRVLELAVAARTSHRTSVASSEGVPSISVLEREIFQRQLTLTERAAQEDGVRHAVELQCKGQGAARAQPRTRPAPVQAHALSHEFREYSRAYVFFLHA